MALEVCRRGLSLEYEVDNMVDGAKTILMLIGWLCWKSVLMSFDPLQSLVHFEVKYGSVA